MLIVRKSPLTGKINEIEIAVTEEQLEEWKTGVNLIQKVMPNISADEREFIMTGLTAEDWDKLMGEDDE